MEQIASQPLNDLPVRPTPSHPTTLQPRHRETLIGITTLIAQRLAFGALVLVTIAFLSHLGLSMAQGTAFQPALAQAASKTLAYLGWLARGDLGLSAAGSVTLRLIPVAEVVRAALSRSLGLLAAALLIATLVGVALGTCAPKRRHSSWSLVTLLASIASVSVPSFFAALLLQVAPIRWTQTFGRALLPVGGFGWDKHIILPALVLAARPIAQIARVTFVSLSEALDQDFVRTAHSKGLRPRQVMNRHVMRNAAIPILTTVGTSLRFSLTSLPVVEFFFGWAGLGFTLLKAISRQDDNLTVPLILCLGILFILMNLLLDIGYRLIDPRLRETPAHIGQGERGNLAARVKSIPANPRDLIGDNPISNWAGQAAGWALPQPLPRRAGATRDALRRHHGGTSGRTAARLAARHPGQSALRGRGHPGRHPGRRFRVRATPDAPQPLHHPGSGRQRWEAQRAPLRTQQDLPLGHRRPRARRHEPHPGRRSANPVPDHTGRRSPHGARLCPGRCGRLAERELD